jgi:malic enzyme
VMDDRPGLEAFKATYARSRDEIAGCVCADASRITLEEAVRQLKPTILIGTSATAQLFSEAVVKSVSDANVRPIVFPLSNPTSKSECTAEEAIRWSDGRAIVATGSPFEPVTYRGRRHRIGQGNNAFIFPGVGLGLWVGRVRRVSDAMFLDAARALARQVRAADLDEGLVYPELSRIRDCSRAVACAVIRRAIAEGEAAPLDDIEAAVTAAMWQPRYLPIRFEPQRADTGVRGERDSLVAR